MARAGGADARGDLPVARDALGSSAVLLFFESQTHSDLRGFGAVLAGSFAGSVLLFGIVFSIGNALLEEIIFHGILFDAAESQWGV